MSVVFITRSMVTISLGKTVKRFGNPFIKMNNPTIKKINNQVDGVKTLNSNDITSILDLSENKISVEVSTTRDFNLNLLQKLVPHFVSITWLGTQYLQLPNDEIPAIVLARKLNEIGLPVVLHLPGRNFTKNRMFEILCILKDIGIRHILAVQGDWPHVLEKDDTKCDFPYASDLVLYIKNTFVDQFCVGVAAYPNLHIKCQSLEDNLKFLKQKVSKGADFIITQAVFDYESLENFVKICRQHGINVPVFPGIFPIKSYKSLVNMAKWCEFKVPTEILQFVEKNQDNASIIRSYGVDLGKSLIRRIVERTDLFAGVHIFSMNDIDFVQNVIDEYRENRDN